MDEAYLISYAQNFETREISERVVSVSIGMRCIILPCISTGNTASADDWMSFIGTWNMNTHTIKSTQHRCTWIAAGRTRDDGRMHV